MQQIKYELPRDRRGQAILLESLVRLNFNTASPSTRDSFLDGKSDQSLRYHCRLVIIFILCLQMLVLQAAERTRIAIATIIATTNSATGSIPVYLHTPVASIPGPFFQTKVFEGDRIQTTPSGTVTLLLADLTYHIIYPNHAWPVESQISGNKGLLQRLKDLRPHRGNLDNSGFVFVPIEPDLPGGNSCDKADRSVPQRAVAGVQKRLVRLREAVCAGILTLCQGCELEPLCA